LTILATIYEYLLNRGCKAKGEFVYIEGLPVQFLPVFNSLTEEAVEKIQAMKKYPNISEIIKKKKQQRRSLAALPFEKEIEMVFKLRERRKFIKSGRVFRDSSGPNHERAK